MEDRKTECHRCGLTGPFWVLGVFEDYIVLGCTGCRADFTVVTGRDHD